jgi:hypothetical protein
MGIPMIVKKAFRPKGSGSPLLKPGSVFEASNKQQANLAKAMGWCDFSATPAAVVEVAAKSESYATKAETARPPAAKKVAAKKTTGKGWYSRRDLTAEE